MRVAALFLVLLVCGCGGSRRAAQPVAPAYPGASDARTTTNASFATTDWTLPDGARATAVYDWYVARLTKLGWKVTQRNETGLHAEKGSATLDVGVRGTTLEINKG
jgi:hypothetical protein